MARLRMRSSDLKGHLHSMKIIESSACSCGFKNEDEIHLLSQKFLACPLYYRPRVTLLNALAHIAPLTVRTLLYGNDTYEIEGLVWFGLCCLMTPGLSKVNIHTFGVMYDHTFYKQVQIRRSDMRPHIKWAVSLVILHMITSIFLRALCGYIWVNILTLSPLTEGFMKLKKTRLL